MGNLTELDGLISIDDLEPHGVRAYDNALPDRSWAGHSCADVLHEHPPIDLDDIGAWARQARGANGLGGDNGAAAAASPFPANSNELQRTARIERAFTLAGIIAEMAWTVGAFARRAYARYRQRREASASYEALRQLDDHVLRDLGIDRSELSSVVAEATGEAEHTRLRVVLAPSDPQW